MRVVQELRRRLGSGGLAVALALLGLLGLEAWAAVVGTFTPMANGPGNRTGVSLTVSDQVPERAYAFGGLQLLSTTNDLYVFEPAGNSWATPADTTPPPARGWHGSVWDSVGQRLLVFGGSSGTNGTVLGDLWAYNPATLAWSQLTQAGDVPGPRWGPVLEYVPHLNRVLLFSGAPTMSSGTKVASVDTVMRWLTLNYATNTATWATITPSGAVPPGRNTSCAGYDAVARRLYVFWGETVNANVPDGWRYDVDTNTWTLLSPTGTLPQARIAPICAWDGRTKQLLAYGGANNPTNNTMLSDAWAYDPALNEWQQLTPTPGTRTTSGSDYSPALRSMLIFGGRTGALTVTNQTYRLFANHPPTADAGVDQTVPSVAPVTLAGSGSDADADPLTFAWAQTSGPSVTLSGSTTPTPGFTAPTVAADTALEFQLTVSDGAASATDRVVVTVQALVNAPPTADAGVDLVVNEQALVTLSGSGADPDSDPLTFSWAQTLGPAVTLSGATTPTPSFTSPTVTASTVLEFELTVSDGKGGTAADRVRVTVQDTINEPPTADAGVDRTVGEQVTVVLSGSGSDPNGDPLTYAWTQTLGPAVTLVGAATPTPSFATPRVTASTVLEFELTVSDGRGGSASDRVRVTVQDTVNEPPTASAGPDQVVGEQVAVALAGGGSDPNGDPLTFAWAQTLGPAVTLTGAATATPGFTSPTVTTSTALEFELTVSDGRGGTAADRVRVTVQDTVNEAPLANAGPDQATFGGALVTLDGTGSSDPNGDPLTFAWVQTQGPAVTLGGATSAGPSWVAPLGVTPAVLEFELTVSDGRGGTATDRVQVTVAPNQAPIADAGVDQRAPEGTAVQLDGSGSSDPDGDVLTFAWAQTAGPAVTLTGPSTARPDFTAPAVTADTRFEFELTVADPHGASATDRVEVVVAPTPNDPPVAHAGDDQVIDEGQGTSLDGRASFDPEGGALVYAWSQVSGPTAALTLADSAQPLLAGVRVVGDTPLEFELRVTDVRGAQATDRVVVLVREALNDAPIADAGVDQSVSERSTAQLDGTGSADPEGQPLTFAWSQLEGPPVTLDDATSATPGFTAPAVTSPTALRFELRVTDPGGASATDEVAITVLPGFRQLGVGCGCGVAGFEALGLLALAVALRRRARR